VFHVNMFASCQIFPRQSSAGAKYLFHVKLGTIDRRGKPEAMRAMSVSRETDIVGKNRSDKGSFMATRTHFVDCPTFGRALYRFT
jgi:hypothetical protein